MDRKYLVKLFEKLLGIVVPYLLMKFLLCHGFITNLNSTVMENILHERLEKYFFKGFLFWNAIQIT